jgi:hypothetical protein
VSGQFHAPAALTPAKEPNGTHLIRGWVGPRTGLEAAGNRTPIVSIPNELSRLCAFVDHENTFDTFVVSNICIGDSASSTCVVQDAGGL